MTEQPQAACTCTGTDAGLNACSDCPTPWPDIPSADRIRKHPDEVRGWVEAATNAGAWIDRGISAGIKRSDQPTSAALDQIASVIRDFPFDDYGLDDLAHLLADSPDTQEWVPALATAVLDVIRSGARIAATLARMSEADVQRVIDVIEAGPSSGAAIEGEWERGWDSAMDAVRSALTPPTDTTKEQ